MAPLERDRKPDQPVHDLDASVREMEEDRARVGPVAGELVERMRLQPTPALTRMLSQPDMDSSANAGVKAAIYDVLVEREGKDAADAITAEAVTLRVGAGPEGETEVEVEKTPAERAKAVLEANGVPGKFVEGQEILEFSHEEGSGKLRVKFAGPQEFKVDGKKIMLESVLTAVLVPNHLTEIEGVKAKSGWFTARVEEIHREGNELLIVTSLKTVRVGVDAFNA